MKQVKNCIICGNEFDKPYSESVKNWIERHKYCSRECANKSKKGKKFSPKTEFKKGHRSWNKDTKGLSKSNCCFFTIPLNPSISIDFIL